MYALNCAKGGCDANRITGVCASTPCRTGFSRTTALPSGVLGPPLRFRFAGRFFFSSDTPSAYGSASIISKGQTARQSDSGGGGMVDEHLLPTYKVSLLVTQTGHSLWEVPPLGYVDLL